MKVQYYTAKWCGPCRQFSPVFEELKSEFPNATFEKIDIDENSVAARDAGITAVPTIIIEGGQKFLGAQSKNTIKEAIEEACKNTN